MQHLDYSQQDSWRQSDDTPLQSPIAINTTTTQSTKESDLALTFDGQTVYDDRVVGEQFLVTGELKISGETWDLERIHFHDGAEHVIDGVRHDLEIHFVYRQGERILVLAVLGDVTDKSIDTHIQEIFTKPIDAKLIADWLPEKHSYYRYAGSLTTPPLGPKVIWIVLSEPIVVSAADLAVIHERYPNNHRDIQDISDRDVLSVHVEK